jgi:hypothetical protein
MKILASFFAGAVCAIWLFPPTPTVSLSDMDKEKIVWEVLDNLERNGYNITQGKLALTQPKHWWQF